MRVNEIKEILKEWGGTRSFPGTGNGLFSRQHYVYIANILSNLTDESIKEYITNWFVDVFVADSYKFKKETFREAVNDGISGNNNAKFQSRHYYYLAKFVSDIQDVEVRDFIANWLAENIGQKMNPNFNISRWKEFCGVE